MSHLRDNITSEFDTLATEWKDVHNETRRKVTSFQSYYTATPDRLTIEQKTDNDRNALTTDLNTHKRLAAKGNNIKRDVETQVQSSENRVDKMKKYGRPAALGLALLGAVIGGAIGAKAPGLGQVPAIAVGAVVGFIALAIVACVLYLVVMWKFKQQRNMWKRTKNSNQESLELVGLINKKESDLREIRNELQGIEEANMRNNISALNNQMNEYLR